MILIALSSYSYGSGSIIFLADNSESFGLEGSSFSIPKVGLKLLIDDLRILWLITD